MLINELQNQSGAFKRGLGLLLVVFIIYGTTVEAAHRHGRVLPTGSTASAVDGDQTSSPASSKTGCSDCLICQFQHNFTTTLIVFGIATPPAQIQTTITAAVPPDVLSQLTGPTAGRAPPSIS
jgi:hypothetical protein